MKSRKLKNISEIEQGKIYFEWISGHYYQKELCEKYKISPHILKKVVETVKERISD